ncbi:hypothetical protein PL8927_600011 [Planktothrix serta PCC 8927]|uniref:Serine/threonine protein kinase n=1 Tax=Planktothrix serta PCC 8927 TaxID=671068 RepID=A0A7Z9DZE7_9CYAN|nr:hypothetical protein PL8927_600011 [Planktothrix serta PCC 8927]
MLPEISPGTLINNRYQIQQALGRGSFGRTTPYFVFCNSCRNSSLAS